MTMTNHLLTGALLGALLPLPVALPLAFVSHFALDAVPHFGFPNINARMKHLNLMRLVIALDFLLGLGLSIWLLESGHLSWWLVGLVAYSPDLVWVYRFTVLEKFGKVRPKKGNRFIRFHKGIQKYERIWGGAVEVVYGMVLLTVLLQK